MIGSVTEKQFRQLWFGLSLDRREEIFRFPFVVWKNAANLSANATVGIERTVSQFLDL